MAAISDVTKTVCLKLYHSNDFSDLEKYISAIYYAEDGRFIWETCRVKNDSLNLFF